MSGEAADGQETVALSPSALMLGVLLVSLLGVVWVGVYPAPLVDLIDAASHAILPAS